jgi:hypothetical protein
MQEGCYLVRELDVASRDCLCLLLVSLCHARPLPSLPARARLLHPSLQLHLHLPQDDSDSDSLPSPNQRWNHLAVWLAAFPLVFSESEPHPHLHLLQLSLSLSSSHEPKELAMLKTATTSCPGHAPPHLGMIPML